jgi:hypothetical protein
VDVALFHPQSLTSPDKSVVLCTPFSIVVLFQLVLEIILKALEERCLGGWDGCRDGWNRGRRRRSITHPR